MRDSAASQEFTRAGVRRMLHIKEAQLKRWEREGLIAPAETFTFSDLSALQTLLSLRRQGVPARRIGRALESIKRKLTDVRQPLAELKISTYGRRIAVQVAGQKMEPITGQLLFNFDAAEAGAVRTLTAKPARDERSRCAEAEAWFQKGLALEETGAPIEEAKAAYAKAVELNGAAAGALLNLGTIAYRQQNLKEAEKYYRRAIAVDPRYALAHFNLGNLFDEVNNLPAAQEQYQVALGLNPNYADAHFNLALLSEKSGDPLRAVRHWKAYLKLDGTSAWADIARRQLARLRESTIIRNNA